MEPVQARKWSPHHKWSPNWSANDPRTGNDLNKYRKKNSVEDAKSSPIKASIKTNKRTAPNNKISNIPVIFGQQEKVIVFFLYIVEVDKMLLLGSNFFLLYNLACKSG